MGWVRELAGFNLIWARTDESLGKRYTADHCAWWCAAVTPHSQAPRDYIPIPSPSTCPTTLLPSIISTSIFSASSYQPHFSPSPGLSQGRLFRSLSRSRSLSHSFQTKCPVQQARIGRSTKRTTPTMRNQRRRSPP